jgi:DNA-binding transcriptional ArsR family regulator
MATLEQLLATLARLETASAKELVRELGVSQPTVSRLLKASGERVCRMGRGHATRYTRTRELPGLGTHLPVYRIGEAGGVQPLRELHLLLGGGHWLAAPDGTGERFVGLPPFAVDMSPQGYVGRTFSARFPELELPPRLVYWSDDQRLLALARRGEDCVGNLILGQESLDRWLTRAPEPAERSAYPELARRSALEQPGSSAGGEQPKFLTYSEGRHVLVKFAGDDGAAARRWRDLLASESLALEEVRAAGLDAAQARWFDERGFRFLEVERFDRVGARGRRGVLSLGALDAEYVGSGGSWTRIASRLLALGRLGPEDARRIRWLDVFGNLIGNTDRHPGNLSVFYELDGSALRLAPVYDMLPMVFAPSETTLVERPFVPMPPTADTLDVWADAARHAHAFWTRLVDCTALSDDFRELAKRCQDTLEGLRRRVPL